MDYSQQDSQEFLRFLLDGMSEDLCRKHSSNTEEDVQPGRSEPALRVGANNEQMSPTTGALSTSRSRKSLHFSTDGVPTYSSQVNNFSGSPYVTPGGNLDESMSSVMTKSGHTLENGRHEKLSLLQVALTNTGSSAALLSEDVDSRDVPTPTAVSTKLRLLNEVNAARNKALSGEEVEHEDDLNSVGTQDPSDDELSVDKNDISGNIVSVIQNRRSLRVKKESRDEEVDGTTFNAKQSGSESVMRKPHNNNTEATASAPLQIVTTFSPNAKAPPPPATAPPAVTILTPQAESAIAWKRYLKLNDSVITDIFAGQLQSTIECLTCRHRSSSYDPFLDLSVPIHKEGENGTRGFMSAMKNVTHAGGDNKSTLEKCLTKFTAEEMLDGDNMYQCEKCKTKRKSVKKLSIFRYPKVLVRG